MIIGIESVNLFSENAANLAKFYQEVVGLKLTNEAVMGESDEFFAFEFGDGTNLYIVDHSKVKGRNKNPEQIMINFEVDNIDEMIKKLDDGGALKIQDKYHIEGYGWVATYEDMDGNYIQLVQVRPN